MSYTPKNNFNLQIGRTGIGKQGFRKKLLADVACCDLKGYEYYGGFPLETSLEFSRDLAVHGGCPNFSWEVVDSVYFTFAEATTAGRTNTINADSSVPIDATELAVVEDSCGHELVFLILYCGGGGISITPLSPTIPDPPDDPPFWPPWRPVHICIPDPNMEWATNPNATIAQDAELSISIEREINKPFDWSVGGGTGFSLKFSRTAGKSNVLIASPTSCGTAVITVVGCDKVSVTGYVRGAVGQWVHKSAYDNQCLSPGGGSYIGGTLYEKIYGNKKLRQSMAWAGCTSFPLRCNQNPTCPGTEGCADWTDDTCLPWDCKMIYGETGVMCNGACCNHTCASSSWGYCPYISQIRNYEWEC